MTEDENPDVVDLDAAQTQVQENRLLEQMDRDGEIAQLNKLLQDEPTRDFLWRVLGKCGIYAEPFDANYGKVSYLLGRASIGRWLLTEICEADPTAEIAMKTKANQLAHVASQKQAASRRRRRS